VYEYRISSSEWIEHPIGGIGDANAMFEDTRGNIWMGAHRYDGKVWSRLTTADGLVSTNVNAILEDSRGDLWFATPYGVSRCSHGIWTTFTEDDGLAEKWTLTIHEDRMGNLWFGAYLGGVSRHNSVALNSLSVNKLAGVRAILKDRDGNLWFGTAHGATIYDGKTWNTITFAEAYTNHYYDDLAANAVFSINEDEEGWLSFGLLDGRLYLHSPLDYEGIPGRSVGYMFEPLGSIIWAIALEEDPDRIWLGTQHGAMVISKDEFGPPASVPSSVLDFPVRAILKDTNGHLWFGTDGGGITVYQGEMGWRRFQAPDHGLVDNHVRTLMHDRQGSIWVGTLRGISIYEDSRWRDFEMPSQLTGFPVMAILEDIRGNYWLGTEGGGVGKCDGSTWQVFTSDNGLAEDVVWSIAEDDIGHLWFGTASSGVSRYSGREWTTFTDVSGYTMAPLDRIYDSVYSILEDRRGDLWFTTHGGGVTRYDGRNWTTFTTANGLGDDWVFDIFVDGTETVWVLTSAS
jgi:ligand-binding sensor domain-containing protein